MLYDYEQFYFLFHILASLKIIHLLYYNVNELFYIHDEIKRTLLISLSVKCPPFFQRWYSKKSFHLIFLFHLQIYFFFFLMNIKIKLYSISIYISIDIHNKNFLSSHIHSTSYLKYYLMGFFSIFFSLLICLFY